jgi:hypothetical protein
MSEGDNEIDELREKTRGTDRISADAGDGNGGEDDGAGENEGGNEEREGSEKKQNGSGTETAEETDPTETETGGRANDTPLPSGGFERALKERAGRTESGIDPRTVSATDPALSAFLLALQDAGELDDVGGAIADGLGAPAPPEYDRDAVVRLAVAYALEDVAPEYFGALAEQA